MRHYSRAELMAGASAIPAGLETKDANLDVETKAAMEKLSEAFSTFKTKNDERLKQLEKRGEDAVTKDEVEKINKGIDDLKAEVQSKLDEFFKKSNRAGLGGADAEAEAREAKQFADLVGIKGDFTAEQLREYKTDLAQYLRRNEVKAQSMMVGSDPSGGYLVSPDKSGRMVKKVYESSPMRQICSVVQIGTDKLEGPIDNGQIDAAWVGEQQTRQQTDAAQFGMWEIPVNELYAYPWVTQKLLEDASIDIEAWLSDKGASRFVRKENSGFVVGDGVLKPRGLFMYPVATTNDDTRPWGTFQYIASGKAGDFAATNPADKLLDLIFEVKAAYRQKGKFLGSRRTMGGIRKLKDGQGNYLTGLRLSDGALVETVFGFEYVDGEDVPVFSTDGNLALSFGDHEEAYTIVDRLGVTVVRDNITKPGFVKFNMRKRVGGGAVNFEAVKFMKFATA